MMKISRKQAVPALGALCLSVVVSLNAHQGGTHFPTSDTKAGHHAVVTADPGGPSDPGWDGTADPGDGGPDPGWD